MKIALHLLLCCPLLLTLATHGQTAFQNKVDPNTYLPFKIALNNDMNQPLNRSFFLKVYDNRDDTSRIGFFKGDGYTYYAFQFKESAMPYLSMKLNDNVKDPLDTLHVVFKKIWIYEAEVPVRRDFKVKGVGSRIEANIYLKKGEAFYLYQTYDSTILSKGYLGSRADDILSKGFFHFRRTAYSLPESADLTKLQQFNELPFSYVNYPILRTTSYKNGIYRTLQDFVNNNPLQINFNYEVKKNKEKIVLQNPLASDSIDATSAWGFCKEGVPYMRIGNSFSKLTLIEKSFELRTFNLARYSETKRLYPVGIAAGAAASLLFFPQLLGSGLLIGLIPPNNKFEAFSNMSSFKLDLNTGEIY